jgi:hypothetical protein
MSQSIELAECSPSLDCTKASFSRARRNEDEGAGGTQGAQTTCVCCSVIVDIWQCRAYSVTCPI